MRNLKKILALVLALVMSFSLMATANAFTDSEKITDTYETAVTVLDGLKVFQGYEDGSFRPQDAIKRSEVAAIIYRIVTGDVAGTQVGIYADYNKFDDVPSTAWYAGYVNFCANAEYIKGRDAKTFDPKAYVTGYEALAMILRAIGYDKNGEFTGSNWQVQTAATGELRGITKNISEGTLGTYATREVVAEILFQTILVDKVNYTPAFGYQLDDTSLGWDTFELEEIEGVVVANEYADLYGTKPLKAGRTELDVDGDSYVIDYTSTLEDIGEARYAYITEGKNVLALGDAGNTVFETGAKADIDTDKKFESVTGLERGDAEEFINFDGGDTYKASDWKIKYVVAKANIADLMGDMNEAEYETANDGKFSAYTSNGETIRIYTKEISRGKVLTGDDIDIMEMIFDDADLKNDKIVIGEIYVGTQSKTDISDDPDVSWKIFKDKYIETAENAVQVEDNENGNWLKVIDNDGDGVADIVLKTIYTFAVMEDINRDDELELTAAEAKITHNIDSINAVDEDTDIVCADELSDGDVVYYAVIDGNAQTYLADMVTAEIDKVDRRNDTAITTDGDEYVESAVCNHTNRGYYDEVTDMAGGTSYDMYLDKFGYLGVFIETATTGDFTLIVNGWYDSLKTGDEYAVLAWNGEDLETVDVTKNGDMFISDGLGTLNNSWGALREFGEYGEINASGNTVAWDGDDYTRTTVATLDDNGKLTPVDEVFTRKDVNIIDLGYQYLDDSDWYKGYAYESDDVAYDSVIGTGTNGNFVPTQVEIRALSTTVYYFVYPSSSGFPYGNSYDDVVVNEYVGYKNVPSLDEFSSELIEDVYAVGTLTSRDYTESESGKTSYYTANVVVVEFSGRYLADAEQVFIADTPVVGSKVEIDEVEVIREDGTFETVKIDLEQSVYPDIADMSRTWADYGKAGDRTLMPGLYYMWETKDEGIYSVTYMWPKDIKASGDYVTGEVETSGSTMNEDWVSIHEFNFPGDYLEANFDTIATGDYSQYVLTADSKFYTLSYDASDDYNAALKPSTAKIVLDELGDRDTTKDGYVYDDNTVLVAYNSDDEIVYAISFANYDGENDTETAMVTNFAQDVWNSVKPAGKTVVPFSVTFYGTPVTGSTTVEYRNATATGLEVKGADNHMVTPQVPTYPDPDGGVYTLIVKEAGEAQVTWTLTLNPAQVGTALKDDTLGDNGIVIKGNVIQVANGEYADDDALLAELKDLRVTIAGDDVNSSDRATITIKDNKVTVDPENPETNPAEYTIVYGSFVTIDGVGPKFYKIGERIQGLDPDATYSINDNADTLWTGTAEQVTATTEGVLKYNKKITVTVDGEPLAGGPYFYGDTVPGDIVPMWYTATGNAADKQTGRLELTEDVELKTVVSYTFNGAEMFAVKGDTVTAADLGATYLTNETDKDATSTDTSVTVNGGEKLLGVYTITKADGNPTDPAADAEYADQISGAPTTGVYGADVTVGYSGGGTDYHICYEYTDGSFSAESFQLTSGSDSWTFTMPASNITLHVMNSAAGHTHTTP